MSHSLKSKTTTHWLYKFRLPKTYGCELKLVYFPNFPISSPFIIISYDILTNHNPKKRTILSFLISNLNCRTLLSKSLRTFLFSDSLTSFLLGYLTIFLVCCKALRFINNITFISFNNHTIFFALRLRGAIMGKSVIRLH